MDQYRSYVDQITLLEEIERMIADAISGIEDEED
jgi:hypothetical protein